MKNVAFHNLGCKVNSYEMEVMQQIVQKRGYKIVQFTQKADAYVVNTCTVTNIADRKSRQMLHRAKQLNPDAVVVAVGCYAQTGEGRLLEDDAVDIIIGNNHKTEIADILDEYFEKHSVGSQASSDMDHSPADNRMLSDKPGYVKPTVISDLNKPSEYENATLVCGTARTRADVKIQDGCNQFCSYCAIPLARGRARSRKPDDVIEEIRTLVENGHKEIVITGIHVCSYGIDFDDEAWKEGKVAPSEHMRDDERIRDYRGETKLFDLLEMIDREIPDDRLKRIRLGSLEPRVITEENVRRLVKIKRICPHFHLSLQSGCDDTLKRMNRHYNSQEYKEGAELIRKMYRDAGISAAITTDVIVGFPGETDEEFDITRKYLEELKLYEMHIFKYSRRKGTVADSLPGQIPEEIKNIRSDILLEMTERHSREYREGRLGQTESVLIEEKKGGYYVGHTGDYIKVLIPGEEMKAVRNTAPDAVWNTPSENVGIPNGNEGYEGLMVETVLEALTDRDEVIGKILSNA